MSMSFQENCPDTNGLGMVMTSDPICSVTFTKINSTEVHAAFNTPTDNNVLSLQHFNHWTVCN